MNDLQNMLERAWSSLEEGAAPGRSPFSMVYFSSNGLNGRPRVRTVVLRSVDRAGRVLGFNTDLRSPKAAELIADGRVSVLAYDRDGGFQIRIEGEAVLHRSGDFHAAAWATSADRSRVCYRHKYGPGSPLDDPALGDPDTSMTNPDDPEAGIENFGAVAVHAERIDVLDLAANGHRRASFERLDDWCGGWVAP